MNPSEWAIALSVSVFFGIIACMEAGFRLGTRRHADSAYEGIGAIEAAVFALLGLLLGFSMAGGMSRLDHRRELIVTEANAIGTASSESRFELANQSTCGLARRASPCLLGPHGREVEGVHPGGRRSSRRPAGPRQTRPGGQGAR